MRERERETDRQTDRQTGRETERDRDRERERERVKAVPSVAHMTCACAHKTNAGTGTRTFIYKAWNCMANYPFRCYNRMCSLTTIECVLSLL